MKPLLALAIAASGCGGSAVLSGGNTTVRALTPLRDPVETELTPSLREELEAPTAPQALETGFELASFVPLDDGGAFSPQAADGCGSDVSCTPDLNCSGPVIGIGVAVLVLAGLGAVCLVAGCGWIGYKGLRGSKPKPGKRPETRPEDEKDDEPGPGETDE